MTSDSSSELPKDTPSSLTPSASASGERQSRKRLRKFPHGYPSAPPNRTGKKGPERVGPADPAKLMGQALNLIKSRLRYIDDHVDVSKWSAAVSKEVTDYVRALSTIAREHEDAALERLKELKSMTHEELQRLADEGDEASE